MSGDLSGLRGLPLRAPRGSSPPRLSTGVHGAGGAVLAFFEARRARERACAARCACGPCLRPVHRTCGPCLRPHDRRSCVLYCTECHARCCCWCVDVWARHAHTALREVRGTTGHFSWTRHWTRHTLDAGPRCTRAHPTSNFWVWPRGGTSDSSTTAHEQETSPCRKAT